MIVLDVYLEGYEDVVGKLVSDDKRALSFSYTDGYSGMPLSVRMAVGEMFGDIESRIFFENLLQEGRMLERIAAQHRIERSDVAGLLVHLGKECAGAVSVVPEGQPPAKNPGNLSEDYDVISEDELVSNVSELYKGKPPQKEVAFSIAGVQSKMAVSVDGYRKILRPKKHLGAPTNAILKVGNAEDEVLVENEFVCLKTAQKLGLPVIDCEMGFAGEISYLIVPRYDRIVEDDIVFRLHQEDCCQAMGLPLQMKYQKDGDPTDNSRKASFENLFKLQYLTKDPLLFRQTVIEATFFNYLVGNADAHAKNFALLYDAAGRPLLSLLYDIVCVALYPDYSQEMAMRIGGCKMWDDVGEKEWHAFLETAGIKGVGRKKLIETRLKKMATNILPVMREVLEENGLTQSRVKLVVDCVGERIEHLNSTFGWDIETDTDEFRTKGGGWLMS